MQVNDFIRVELMVVIPVLMYLGTVLKQSEYIANKHIPLVITLVSVAICGLYLGATMDITNSKEIAMFLFSSITQGCVTGLAACGSYETFKHLKK